MQKTHVMKHTDSCGAANDCTVADVQAAVTRQTAAAEESLQPADVHVKRLQCARNTNIDTFLLPSK